ncbi:alpha/beta fold hydrolase [Marinomonas sp. THO17]|uniref:alpha/beta hydrolase family protein n=1 Tax=Marinomonas sp. THO17 TaxID=3149048 RepID=UPI00336BBC6B
MKTITCVIAILISSLAFAKGSIAVGFDQIILYADSDRPLKTSLWYPTTESFPKDLIADNRAFAGTRVVRIGQPANGSYPLVVMSHGYRGNWRNQNWLAMKLVQAGYIVAAVDHPGTTSFNHDPNLAKQWWARPGDISRLLDWLLERSDLRRHLDPQRISAIGHSLGGWTVMALAGAKVDIEQLAEACRPTPNSRVCGLRGEFGMLEASESAHNNLKDSRIKKLVSLDLGLAKSFSLQSLSELTRPTLILAAGIDIGDLPQQQESGFLAQYLPQQTTQYKVYSNASHFSFMQLCKPGAIELLEEEVPGDGIICLNEPNTSREALHDTIFQDILAFLSS